MAKQPAPPPDRKTNLVCNSRVSTRVEEEEEKKSCFFFVSELSAADGVVKGEERGRKKKCSRELLPLYFCEGERVSFLAPGRKKYHGYNLRRAHQEGDPRHNDEESGRQVVGDDVEGDLPGEHHLEAGHRVVHAQRHVVRLVGPAVKIVTTAVSVCVGD